MYTFDSKVRYSEIDHRGTMTLPALINYFQDCSTFQSESLGFGVKAAKEKKKSMDSFLLAGCCRTVSRVRRRNHSGNICQ